MENQSITANDLKWLHSGTSRSWIMGVFSVAFFLGMSFLHFCLAAAWARLAGITLSQAWQGWLSGISPNQQYAGIYLKAMEQFDACGMLLVFAVFSSAMCFLNRYERERKVRLLAVIVGQGQAAA